jgi:hypothetical protein
LTDLKKIPTVSAAHRTVANYGVLFKTDAKGKDVEVLNNDNIRATIKAKIQKNKVGFMMGGNGCLAYQNDSVWTGLRAISGNKFFLRSTRKGDVTKYGVLISLTHSNRGFGEEVLQDLNYMIDLYVRLPLLLLDPDPRNKIFGERRSPAESGCIRQFARANTFAAAPKQNPLKLNGIFLDVFFPGYVFAHPALAWFTNALVREAVHLAIGFNYHDYSGKDNTLKKHALFNELINLVSRKELTRIINGGDYAAALKLWCTKVGPLLEVTCEYNSPDANVWYNGSLEKFNKIVSDGGWITLGTDVEANWKFKGAFRSHAGTAKAWESFLRRRSGVSFAKLTKISAMKIQKKFKSLLRKSPWMTATKSAK